MIKEFEAIRVYLDMEDIISLNVKHQIIAIPNFASKIIQNNIR